MFEVSCYMFVKIMPPITCFCTVWLQWEGRITMLHTCLLQDTNHVCKIQIEKSHLCQDWGAVSSLSPLGFMPMSSSNTTAVYVIFQTPSSRVFLLSSVLKWHIRTAHDHTQNVICMYILGHTVFLIWPTTVKLPSRCVSRHCIPCTHTVLWVNEPTRFVPPLTTFSSSSQLLTSPLEQSTHSLWILVLRHLLNVQTDKCLEVNHGWGSCESDVGYVIVLCSVPPGKTMWWSAHVTSVFPQVAKKNSSTGFFHSVTIICGSPVRRLHWGLLCSWV